jgi:hypothetical protein
MSPPDGDGSLGGQAPDDDPAIGIASHQPRVLAYERDTVDLRSMAPEDVGRLGRGQGHLDTPVTTIRGLLDSGCASLC